MLSSWEDIILHFNGLVNRLVRFDAFEIPTSQFHPLGASNRRIVNSEELLQPLESPAFAFFASCDISLIVRAVISSTNDSKSSRSSA